MFGREVPIVGCSAQGVVGPGKVREDGFAAGLLALGGDSIAVSHAVVEDVEVDTREKGRRLGRELKARLPDAPRLVILHHDSLAGADVEPLLDGLWNEVECTVVGGAAAHAFNYRSLEQTFQYHGERALSRAAVACAISGQFSMALDICHGCSPAGVELTVTRAEGNVLLELDGRPAADVWREICGPEPGQSTHSSALALGIPREGASDGSEYLVGAAYAIDLRTGAVVLASRVRTGTRIMIHHRTVEDVLQGSRAMGERLERRLSGKPPRAVLGFECGARTRPFLGDEATLEENLALQRALGEETPWLGMMPWGEIFPGSGRPVFHNYSYSMLVLAD